jgi:hypothetical protein
VAAVAGWVAVVGATSAVAWVAIDRAGREVLTATAGSAAGPAAVATGAPRTPSAHGPSSSPTSSRTPGQVSPTTGTRPRSSTGSGTHQPATAPTSTTRTTRPTPAPAVVDRSVRVEGGQVGVRCAGAVVSLRFAQPVDGWAVRVGDDGPGQVKVAFVSAAQQRDIEVEAECSGGTPVFSTSDDEHGSDGSVDRDSSRDS